MLEKIIQNVKSHPVATGIIEGAVAGYTVISPLIMILSDKLHINPLYHELSNHQVLDSIKETFTPEFLPWSLTYAAITAATVGIVTHFSNKARVLAERNHAIEKEAMQIRLNIDKKALETKLKHYQDLVDEFHFGIYTSRLDGQLETANPALAKMLGYDTVDELLKVSVDELYADKDEKEQFISELKENNSVYDKQLTLKRKDKTNLKVLCDAKRNGKINGFIFELPEYQKNVLIMCAECSKIRDGSSEDGKWIKPADYLRRYNIETSHSLCKPCAKKLYSE